MKKLTAMTKKRLTILRDALIAHAKDPGNLKFNLESWARFPAKYAANGGDATEIVRGARLKQNFCGTSACAMGLAASLPEFNALGLKLKNHGWGGASVVLVNEDDDDYPKYDFTAAQAFFGLSEEDSVELFAPDMYDNKRERANPLAVADKITALLESNAA